MNRPPAGTRERSGLTRTQYYAPLPLPTGQSPEDTLGIIWRKNDVFIDIGIDDIGGTVVQLWFVVMLSAALTYCFDYSFNMFLFLAFFTSIPLLIVLAVELSTPVPRPMRFNRQRREACVMLNDDEYWIVPWESVSADAFYDPFEKFAKKVFYIRIENPAPSSAEENLHRQIRLLAFDDEAMKLWECVRSYMEIGPDFVPECSPLIIKSEGVFEMLWKAICERCNRPGWFLAILKEVIVTLIFNNHLAIAVVRWRLRPPPDLTHPAIIEWSKQIPPEQWAKPSAEFQAALAEYESRQADSPPHT